LTPLDFKKINAGKSNNMTLFDQEKFNGVKKTTNRRKLTGLVVSDKMNKTVVVKVESVKIHAKYKKRFKVFKKYPAHSEEQVKIGDKVVIEESKPFSKTVHWKVVNKI